ncbi:hypothetical protein BO94DRAFT_37322 [Aspergillus sclerotioniger CBS 115572]|uniref:Uncharacterized protein n=1 Tax=Aspergillus sclerotioniger CBS 115572 TaxID=1450535 RepID=A0A317WWC0_9EURO|nr:hypothetical protein BO94DRAFT_37322 [Aspergillus sclerotioniger CBS 115572]PWY89467.1 hypothetical protein BO94DRAFT_37322 [Aspergillus sclerotioniger CBS 115572]
MSLEIPIITARQFDSLPVCPPSSRINEGAQRRRIPTDIHIPSLVSRAVGASRQPLATLRRIQNHFHIAAKNINCEIYNTSLRCQYKVNKPCLSRLPSAPSAEGRPMQGFGSPGDTFESLTSRETNTAGGAAARHVQISSLQGGGCISRILIRQ